MSKIKHALKNNKLLYKTLNPIITFLRRIKSVFVIWFYALCRLLPLQNKIVVSCFKGMKYGDNPQFILEKLKEINPNIKVVWVKNDDYTYDVPKQFIIISTYSTPWKRAYHYATAKVWLDTHKFPMDLIKRKHQLVINTWHSGLGIKRGDLDVDKFRNNKKLNAEAKHLGSITDIFISNSDFLNSQYKTSFEYKGDIRKIGLPRNDILVNNKNTDNKIKEQFSISKDKKILLYAPTFRDNAWGGNIDFSVYDIDFERVCKTLEKKTGNKWIVLIKFHPFLMRYDSIKNYNNSDLINVTQFQDMQQLLLSCDAFISDYSSCIFDVALRDIPCFTFTTDYDAFKADRGVYVEIKDIPFPNAKSNDELINNIINFDYKVYLDKWNDYKQKEGLVETGHASEMVAEIINNFIKTGIK